MDNPLFQVTLPASLDSFVSTISRLEEAGIDVTVVPVLKLPRLTESGEMTFQIYADNGDVSVLRSTNGTDWIEIGRFNYSRDMRPPTFRDSSPPDSMQAYYKLVQ